MNVYNGITYVLCTKCGMSLDDIGKLEMSVARDWARKKDEEEYDMHMINTINMFLAHNRDITTVEPYKSFQKQKKLRQVDEYISKQKLKEKVDLKSKAEERLKELQKKKNG